MVQSPRRETAVQGGDAYIADELGLFRWDRSRRMERANASSDLDGQSPHRPCRKCGYGWFQREPGVAQYAGPGLTTRHHGDTQQWTLMESFGRSKCQTSQVSDRSSFEGFGAYKRELLLSAFAYVNGVYQAWWQANTLIPEKGSCPSD
jgi:hypothetical protein